LDDFTENCLFPGNLSILVPMLWLWKCKWVGCCRSAVLGVLEAMSLTLWCLEDSMACPWLWCWPQVSPWMYIHYQRENLWQIPSLEPFN